MTDGNMPSYYPEIGGLHRFNNRLTVSVGLGVKTITNYEVYGASSAGGIITESGDTITLYSSSGDSKIRYIFSYLAVPVYLSYVFDSRYSRNNWYLALDFGLQPNVNVAANKYIKELDTQKIPNVNALNNDVVFGCRVGKTISRNWSRDIELELAFRYCYSLTDLTEDGRFGRSDAVIIALGLNFNP